MIRTPLRPLARILHARSKGENPDVIERNNIRIRHEEMRGKSRARAEGRILALSLMLLASFIAVGGRMAFLAFNDPVETSVGFTGSGIISQRADIVDRNGYLLATNLDTYSLYFQQRDMIDPETAAKRLAEIIPAIDEKEQFAEFTGEKKFGWIKKKLSPEQKQLIHEIGEPGLKLGPREFRVYPNGRLAGHVLGGTTFDKEGVTAAEVVGVAGVEKKFDGRLRDPVHGHEALELSIDLAVQTVLEQMLRSGMKVFDAKTALAILMDVKTGEVVALSSLPDFDPNDRKTQPQENADASPLFNRAIQGVYELGSTFKPITMVQALDLGLINPSTKVDISKPIKFGKHEINDYRYNGKSLTATEIMVKSSNIGTARISQMIGQKRHRDFLKALGFLDPLEIEVAEANQSRPLFPARWSELSTMTISFGHGISVTPMHLASAYATIANGGFLVKPTLLKQNREIRGERVLGAKACEEVLVMMRKSVSESFFKMADVNGYAVAGKTGTADKPKKNARGYYKDKVIATFASVFPADSPQYVLVVTLDEAEDNSTPEPKRTAGWTAAPLAAEIIGRLAPLLGLRPDFKTS
ncbi:MAG: penicillin-binding protein 2 [Roseovarius sp.]|nr:penicillin-binding protein 2 [Roseovarius sp.]